MGAMDPIEEPLEEQVEVAPEPPVEPPVEEQAEPPVEPPAEDASADEWAAFDEYVRLLGSEKERSFGFSVSAAEQRELMENPTASKLVHNMRNRFNTALQETREFAKALKAKEQEVEALKRTYSRDVVATARKVAEPVELEDLGEEPDQTLEPRKWQEWKIEKTARETMARVDAVRREKLEAQVEVEQHNARVAANRDFLTAHPELRTYFKGDQEAKDNTIAFMQAKGCSLEEAVRAMRIDPRNPGGAPPAREVPAVRSRSAASALSRSNGQHVVLPPVPWDQGADAVSAYIRKYGEAGSRKADADSRQVYDDESQAFRETR